METFVQDALQSLVSHNPSEHDKDRAPLTRYVEQGRSHAPQCWTSLLVSISHPSLIELLQLAHPAKHVPLQVVPWHTADACSGVGHGVHPVEPQP